MEQQPYPNLPVYLVHLRDGEGCSQTLHSNYPLSISNNLGQVEEKNLVQGDEPIDEPTPMPQAHNELLADGQTTSQPESLHD